MEVHVPDVAADGVHREELFSLRVEADQLLEGTGLREPQAPLIVLGQRVRPRARPARRLPLFRLAGLGIDASQEAARLIDVPHHPIGRGFDAARTRRLAGLLERRYTQRVGIDADERVGAEQRHPRVTILVDDDAVRIRRLRVRRDQIDLLGLHVQPADAVRPLRREPDVAFPVEDVRVRVLRLAGHDDLEPAAARVEPSDAPVAVAGVPDDPLRIDVDAVGIGPLLDLVALELLGLRIEVSDVVPGLPDEPDFAVWRDRRITGAAAPFDGPFLQVDLALLLRGDRRLPRHEDGGKRQYDQSHGTPPISGVILQA